MSSPEPETLASPTLQPGTVLGHRLRLEETLPFLPDQRLWRAVDLRTQAVHAVEVLGPASARSAPLLLSRSGALSVVHPNLLAFYRYEEIDGQLYSVVGDDRRLSEPASLKVTDGQWRDLAVTKRWLHGLFGAIRLLHQRALPAHGAIVPSRIAGGSSDSPLLTGYPYAQTNSLSAADRPFLSPQRAPGQPAQYSDDVYSLAAIGFWLLSLGKERVAGATVSNLIGQIDASRREKGVAALDWPEGTEFALLSGLEEDRAKQPQNAVEFLANLKPFFLPENDPPVTSTSGPEREGGRSFVPRRPAPWRLQQVRRRHERLGRLTGEKNASPAAKTPVELLAQLKQLQTDLAQTENELARRETLLAGERDVLSAQKSALLQQEKEVQRQIDAAAAQRVQVEQARQALLQQQEDRQLRERELEQARALLRQEEEKQASARNLLQQERSRLTAELEQLRARSTDLDTKQSNAAATQARGAEAERKLNEAREEITRREQALGLIQQELTKITGTSDVRQWDFFVQQLRASKADLERRIAAFAKQGTGDASGPSASPPGATSGESSPDLKTPSQPTIEPTRPEIPVTTGATASKPAEPVLAPPLALTLRATIAFPNARRLHLFGGPNLRFGRHGDSDVLLVALQNGVVQTTGVNREISRKHFELRVDGPRVNLIDGWSDDGKASQHGLCVDGRRVMPGGVLLRPGMLISVTTRLTSGAVPHWKVSFLSSSDGLPDPGSKKGLGGVFLKRLDDAPDDVLVLLSKAALSAIGGSGLIPDGTLLIRQGTNFVWKMGETDEELLAVGPSRFPGVTVLSVGWCSPTVALAQV